MMLGCGGEASGKPMPEWDDDPQPDDHTEDDLDQGASPPPVRHDISDDSDDEDSGIWWLKPTTGSM